MHGLLVFCTCLSTHECISFFPTPVFSVALLPGTGQFQACWKFRASSCFLARRLHQTVNPCPSKTHFRLVFLLAPDRCQRTRAPTRDGSAALSRGCPHPAVPRRGRQGAPQTAGCRAARRRGAQRPGRSPAAEAAVTAQLRGAPRLFLRAARSAAPASAGAQSLAADFSAKTGVE